MTLAAASDETRSTVLDLLNREWTTQHAEERYEFGELGPMSCAELFDYVNIRKAPKQERDARLHTVLAISQGCTPEAVAASRTLVQRLIPIAVRLGSTCTALRGLSTDEAVGTAISCLWEAIKCYPIHIRQSVHGTLQLSTLNLVNSSEGLRRTRDRHDEIPTDIDDIDLLAEHSKELDYELGSTATGDESFDDLVRVLTWAIDTGVLERDEVSTLARADLGDSHDRKRLADDMGCSVATMTKRVWRIRRKLIDAVRKYVSDRGEW